MTSFCRTQNVRISDLSKMWTALKSSVYELSSARLQTGDTGAKRKQKQRISNAVPGNRSRFLKPFFAPGDCDQR